MVKRWCSCTYELFDYYIFLDEIVRKVDSEYMEIIFHENIRISFLTDLIEIVDNIGKPRCPSCGLSAAVTGGWPLDGQRPLPPGARTLDGGYLSGFLGQRRKQEMILGGARSSQKFQ